MALTSKDWEIIEAHFPNYSNSSEIYELDILQRYEDEEAVDPNDKAWVQSLKDWRAYKLELEKKVLQTAIDSFKNQ